MRFAVPSCRWVALATIVGGALGCAPAPARIAARPEGTLANRVTGLSGRPFGIRISPSGTVLVTQQDGNSVARFNAGDTTPELSIPVGIDPGDVVFNRDGSRAFVSAFISGSLHVIDVAQNRQVNAIRIASNAYRLAVTPDDARLFVTSTNGNVYVVNPVEPKVTDSIRLGGSLQGIALSRSGRTLLVTSTQGGIWRIDAATLQVLRSNVIPGGLQDVAITADEHEIYVANEKFGVDVLDGTTLARKDRIALTDFAPFGLALTRDETEVYLTSPTTGTARIVDLRSRTAVYTFTLRGTPRRIAFDASGRTAYIANEADWVDVIR
jgi:DNA-binding beta-propeller fold protein YncE